MVASADEPFRVVFVCTGNICRSAMAEVVFRWFGESAGLGSRIECSSAGTGDWHLGEQADPRTVVALERRGYDGTHHRARQFDVEDFTRNDLVIALDRTHERILRGWARNDDDADKIARLLAFDAGAVSQDVPDPYYAAPGMFDEVLGMIESGCRSLFRQLEPALRTAV